MNNKTRYILFFAFAVLSFVALVYHMVDTIKPFDATPAWRHTMFICINAICLYGLIKRPEWFVWFFGTLTIQQLYSHGSHFIRLLTENKFNWIDFSVLLLMPSVFILLLMNRKTKP